MQKWRLEPTGRAKPSKTRRFVGTGPGSARQEAADFVSGRLRNWTDWFLQSKPGPLPGYLDPLLTLHISSAAKPIKSMPSQDFLCQRCGITGWHWEGLEYLRSEYTQISHMSPQPADMEISQDRTIVLPQ